MLFALHSSGSRVISMDESIWWLIWLWGVGLVERETCWWGSWRQSPHRPRQRGWSGSRQRWANQSRRWTWGSQTRGWTCRGLARCTLRFASSHKYIIHIILLLLVLLYRARFIHSDKKLKVWIKRHYPTKLIACSVPQATWQSNGSKCTLGPEIWVFVVCGNKPKHF